MAEAIFPVLYTARQGVEEIFLDNRCHHLPSHLAAKISFGQVDGLVHHLYIHQFRVGFWKTVESRLFLLMGEVVLMGQGDKALMPVADLVVLAEVDDGMGHMPVLMLVEGEAAICYDFETIDEVESVQLYIHHCYHHHRRVDSAHGRTACFKIFTLDTALGHRMAMT